MWNCLIPSIFGANIFQNLGLPTHNNLSDAELLQLHKTTQNNEWLGILLSMNKNNYNSGSINRMLDYLKNNYPEVFL